MGKDTAHSLGVMLSNERKNLHTTQQNPVMFTLTLNSITALIANSSHVLAEAYYLSQESVLVM